MNLPLPRYLNLLGFLLCSAMMAYALYAEHVLFLMPCPLCIFQRIAIIAMGLVFLLSAVQNSSGVGRKIYAALLAVSAGAGVIVAGRHVWLQNMPEDQVPTCGPGFDYIFESFPLGEALALIFTGSGECADIDWVFLGLSMPTWTLISFVVIGAAGVWNNLRTNGSVTLG